MRIVTWNINSVRLRLLLLAEVVKKFNPDLICLQETKAEDHVFPLAGVHELGFPHVVFSGQKSYNGVAILSKAPLTSSRLMNEIGGVVEHKRHISACVGGVELHNFYIPAGGDIPDPAANPAYAHKLRFVDDMTAWAAREQPKHTVILGDFNIAPLEHDVWSHKQLLQVVSHTEPEITRLNALKETLDWCDVGRKFVSPEEKLYSWWSYRNQDWRKSNRGRRLDHIWVTPDLTPRLKDFAIHVDARDWPQPSDHVPVMVELDT